MEGVVVRHLLKLGESDERVQSALAAGLGR
jgi:hypothetical protein